MYPDIQSRITYSSQDMEATSEFINSWMDKEDAVYMYNGILLNHKKNKRLPFAAPGMDLESIMLSEISQTEKYNYCMMSLIYGV